MRPPSIDSGKRRGGGQRQKKKLEERGRIGCSSTRKLQLGFCGRQGRKGCRPGNTVRAGKAVVACKAVGGRLPFKSGINQLRLHELEFLDLVKLRHFCSF